MTVRLQKFLAECGIASRRACESLIEEGRVAVNGEVAQLGQKVEPGTDAVTLDGESVGADRKIYVVLNKPKDVITSASDPHHERTVFDCLKGVPGRVFAVGRLDIDVTGTLIFTNDGELANRIAHPRYHVEKIYNAWVRGRMTDACAQELEQGIELEDGPVKPTKVRVLKQRGDRSLVRVIVREGRKRLVKRLLAAAGHPVCDLHRISIGGIGSGELMPGEWRYLSEEEVAALRARVKLNGVAPVKTP